MRVTKPIDLKSILEENSYLPLEPFCSSTYDHVSTRERILELKEKKTMTALALNIESISLDEVALIDEEFKDEL